MNTLRPASLDMNASSGEIWRLAFGGTTRAYLVHTYRDDDSRTSMALVCGAGRRGKWASKPMSVPLADCFATREDARAEMRRRRDYDAAVAEFARGPR